MSMTQNQRPGIGEAQMLNMGNVAANKVFGDRKGTVINVEEAPVVSSGKEQAVRDAVSLPIPPPPTEYISPRERKQANQGVSQQS